MKTDHWRHFPPAAEPPKQKWFDLRTPDRSPQMGRAFSPSECRTLVSHARRFYAPHDATVGHSGKSRVDPNLRRSTVRWLNQGDPDLWWFFTRLNQIIAEANAAAFGFDLAGYRDVQFTEYDAADQAVYDWHTDSHIGGHRPYDRKLTVVIQLTDPREYEGGVFEIDGDPLPANYFRHQGSALVFPSMMKHRANLVTRGIRHSLVTWVTGPIR